MNLRQFFFEHPHQFIVLLNGFERLDEHGLPTGTGAVDHTLDTPFLLRLHRNYKSFAADCDQLILQSAAFGQPSQIAAQRLLDQPLLFLHLATDARKFWRGAVIERAIGPDLVAKCA